MAAPGEHAGGKPESRASQEAPSGFGSSTALRPAASAVRPTKGDLPLLEFADQRAWEKWLAGNHGQASGVWLKFAKKGSARTTVDYARAVEAALCYGWIDGQAARYDDDYYLQRFTPRRRRSKWSLNNREHAERLIEAGRMRPAGMLQIAAAKADGRWAAAYPRRVRPPSRRTSTAPSIRTRRRRPSSRRCRAAAATRFFTAFTG